MRKLRSDALWHKLTPEQQNQVQHWLFVERLGYVQIHGRMQEELGIACSLSTIGPMYHYLAELRSHERETILEKLTDVITEPGADIQGASFYNYLTYSSSFHALTAVQRESFLKGMPFSRTAAAEPTVNGYFVDDRTYSSGGRALNR